jgi:hypothetical protein
MKNLIILCVATTLLGACAVVPAPYYGAGPAVVVAPPPVYIGPGYYGYHRGWRRW